MRVPRVGLTGGIASGKSTVATLWRGMGASIIDADAISRASTASGGAAIDAIRASFGPGFFDASGALDRGRMRDLVFRDPDAKRRLEAIVHPLVGREMDRQIHEAQGTAVLDIPLLAEGGARWRARLDAVVVVDCSEATQVERAVRRDGLASEVVQRILATQASRAQRLAAADIVLCNDGIAMGALEHLVRSVAQRFGL